jgi:PKD repeat protein
MRLNLNSLKNRVQLAATGSVLALALFAGCTEPPEACFTPSTNLVDINSEVSFENCTEPVAQSYAWTFGDGATSTEVSPKHTYTTEGQFLVGLTAKAKSSANDDLTETLVVGAQRLFASAQIINLPTTNPSGGQWDPADNPDIAVRFAKGSTTLYQSATQTDVALVFPLTVPPPTTTLVLSPEAWTVTVLDIDSGSEEVMATFTVNLATFVPNADKRIPLATGSISRLEVAYTLR